MRRKSTTALGNNHVANLEIEIRNQTIALRQALKSLDYFKHENYELEEQNKKLKKENEILKQQLVNMVFLEENNQDNENNGANDEINGANHNKNNKINEINEIYDENDENISATDIEINSANDKNNEINAAYHENNNENNNENNGANNEKKKQTRRKRKYSEIVSSPEIQPKIKKRRTKLGQLSPYQTMIKFRSVSILSIPISPIPSPERNLITSPNFHREYFDNLLNDLLEMKK